MGKSLETTGNLMWDLMGLKDEIERINHKYNRFSNIHLINAFKNFKVRRLVDKFALSHNMTKNDYIDGRSIWDFCSLYTMTERLVKNNKALDVRITIKTDSANLSRSIIMINPSIDIYIDITRKAKDFDIQVKLDSMVEENIFKYTNYALTISFTNRVEVNDDNRDQYGSAITPFISFFNVIMNAILELYYADLMKQY